MPKFARTIYVKHEDAGDGTTFMSPAEEIESLIVTDEVAKVARYVLTDVSEYEGVVRLKK